MRMRFSGLAWVGLTAAAMVCFLPPAAAQQAPASPWSVVCAEANNPQTCRIQQNLFVEKTVQGKQERVGQLLSLTVLYAGETTRSTFLVIRLPLGVDLRPGMVLRIDTGDEITAPYLRCTKDGCAVQVPLTAQLVALMKKGLKLQVGFRPFGSSKTVVVDASLTGFTKAFGQIR